MMEMKYRLWACLLFLPMVLWASGRPKVAVVLSGGGAKGTAHIGALKVIEEAGIPIDYVVGTSMGAIVGGLYSIGYTPQQLDSMVNAQNWKFLLSDARALVMGQEILLLDEPLSNLDAKLRVEVRTELRQIQQKFGITTMYVTHDQDEALSMSDIIAVMRRGRIEQIGSPWEIYFRPATRFVADFVGTVNFLEGTAHREADGSLSVDHRGMRLRVDEDTDLQGGEPVTLVVRPEGISLMGLEETVPEGTALRGTIENYSFLGRMIRYWVRVGEEVFVIDDANVDLTGARTGDV